MKNTLLVLVTGIISAICVQAQNTQMKSQVAKIAGFRIFEASAPVAGSLSADEKNLINIKALRDFSKTYKNVTDEKWFVIKTGFMARFTLQDIQYRVTYNRKGNWVATFRYYREQQLPIEIYNLVKSTFYNYNIMQVTEVSIGRKTAYLVAIEDNNSLKTIKVVNDEMEVMQDVPILN